MANRQEELADKRTRLAERRTILAQERTFSAWVRTGLACLAAGFAIAKLLATADPQWLITAVGITLIVAGGAMFAMGFWRYLHAAKTMNLMEYGGVPVWIIGIVTVVMLAGAVAALILIFVEGTGP